MSFLPQEMSDNLSAMALLPTSTVWVNGVKKKGKLWLTGENDATLSDVKLMDGRTGYYIECVFTCKPQHIHELITKVSFVPHKAFFSDYKALSEFVGVFGHNLGERPDSMPKNTYLGHVYRRLLTFVGNTFVVVMSKTSQPMRDEYGDVKVINNGWTKKDDTMERNIIVGYGRADWNVLYNMLHN